MTKKTNQIVNKKEEIMIRVDKTLKQLMNEKPSSRWDSNYWHPNYTKMENTLESDFDCERISEIQEYLTLGHVGKMQYVEGGEISVIGVRDILNTGLNPYSSRKIVKDGPVDLYKRRVMVGDLLFVRSGVGSVGRSIVVTTCFKLDLSISGDVYLLRSTKINLHYLAIFLNSTFGNKQIERIGSGVSGQIHLNFPEFGRITVPMLKQKIQDSIETEYKKMSEFHEKAMEAKKTKNEQEYKKNIGTAEKMLNSLIKKTEEVIRGERKDVL